MEFKKVWMSPETGKRSQYGYRTVGGILGIVLLMTLLLFGGTFLSLSMGIEQKGFSLLLLLAVSGLGIGLAILMSRRSIQDATIFFLTEDDRLWVMDARSLSNHGEGFLGFAIGAMETQAFLRKQGSRPFLSNRADEIGKVLNIKENRSHYAVRCQVRPPYLSPDQGKPGRGMAAAGVGAQKNLGECAGANGKPKSTLYPAERPGFRGLRDPVCPESPGRWRAVQ